MYDKSKLLNLLTKVKKVLLTHITYLEINEFFGVDYSDTEKIDSLKKLFTFHNMLEEIEPSDEILENIGFNDFFDLWVLDVISEYEKNISIYDDFISHRIEIMNDIVTKQLACEKSFGLSTELMDNILEYRMKLLNLKLVNADVIDFNTTKIDEIENNITYGSGRMITEEKDMFTTDWTLTQNSIMYNTNTYFTYLKNKISDIVLMIDNLVSNNIKLMDLNKSKIEYIDNSINEIVQIISTCSILVGASPNKRNILSVNYPENSIKRQIATIFIETHSGVEEKFAGKSMKNSLIAINKENKYEETFKNILK